MVVIVTQNSKTQFVTKLKNWKWDQTQKFSMLQNSKTQIVTKLKKKLCQNSKLKMWQNLKTQISTKLKELKLWQN